MLKINYFLNSLDKIQLIMDISDTLLERFLTRARKFRIVVSYVVYLVHAVKICGVVVR